MSEFDNHPTVKLVRSKTKIADDSISAFRIDYHWLRNLCLEAGADDVGFVEIDRPELDDQRQDILTTFSATKTLVCFVRRMNRENLRSPARTLSNLEFHYSIDEVTSIARKIVAALERHQVRALSTAVGFPMEMDRWPDDKMWIISHKVVATAAGLGHMGINRNLIHPKFGNFVTLDTILIDAEVSTYDRPIDYNPCLDCHLCVAACPVGAIEPDGHFNFTACYTHNYRDFLPGFAEWSENLAQSKNAHDYRKKTDQSESASTWQSLFWGENYKAAYCMAVCPAGEDVIGPFLKDRVGFVKKLVKPLQDKEETVYVVPGSDAEAYVARRFPHKKVRHASHGLLPSSIRGFLFWLPMAFQKHQSEKLNDVFHFTFIGAEERKVTIIIRNKELKIEEGHVDTATIHIISDSKTWIRFVNKEENIMLALLKGKIRVKGSLRLLAAFGKCFPS